MAQAFIPVDVFNPGQVFACLGFLEVADQLLGDAVGGYSWNDGADIRFYIRASGDRNPYEVVLEFLAGANVYSLAPDQGGLSTKKWHINTQYNDGESIFPFRRPESPATLPAVLDGECRGSGRVKLIVDYWGDSTSRDNVKFWAGSGGYPGAALVKDTLDLFRNDIGRAINDPFSFSAPQSSSFRFDWRRDYIPLDVGFSPNDHGDMTMIGYPIVELLAAIGLGNARPRRVNKLRYRYGILGVYENTDLFDPVFVRAALGCASLGFLCRNFNMHLGWPGQVNQARCITDVIEEI